MAKYLKNNAMDRAIDATKVEDNGSICISMSDVAEHYTKSRDANLAKYKVQIKKLQVKQEQVRVKMQTAKGEMNSLYGAAFNSHDKTINRVEALAKKLGVNKILNGTKPSNAKINKLAAKNREEAMRLIEVYNKQFVPQSNAIIAEGRATRNEDAIAEYKKAEAKYNDFVNQYNAINEELNSLVNE